VSSDPISFVAVAEPPLVLSVDSGEVVGYFSLPSTGEGEPTTLEPGASSEFPFLGFTSSCKASLGPALPPGSYEILVPMSDPNRVCANVLLTAGPATILLRQP
jgi:hypothetical protein